MTKALRLDLLDEFVEPCLVHDMGDVIGLRLVDQDTVALVDAVSKSISPAAVLQAEQGCVDMELNHVDAGYAGGVDAQEVCFFSSKPMASAVPNAFSL